MTVQLTQHITYTISADIETQSHDCLDREIMDIFRALGRLTEVCDLAKRGNVVGLEQAVEEIAQTVIAETMDACHKITAWHAGTGQNLVHENVHKQALSVGIPDETTTMFLTKTR
jgi:hypothetical protein